MKRTFRLCFRCGKFVKKETRKSLRKEYPFECTYCDENMYRFETVHVRELRKIDKEREQIGA